MVNWSLDSFDLCVLGEKQNDVHFSTEDNSFILFVLYMRLGAIFTIFRLL